MNNIDNTASDGNQTEIGQSSQSSDKYAQWRDLNRESDVEAQESGNSNDNKHNDQSGERAEQAVVKDNKGKPSNSSDTDNQEKRHRSGWERREASLTRRLREMEEKLNHYSRMDEQRNTPKAQKLSRNNFATQQEYDAYERNALKEDVKREALEELMKAQNEVESEQASKAEFQESWSGKYHTLLTPEEKEIFQDLIQSPDDLHEDIHDYIKTSEYGPAMMLYILAHPEIKDNLNNVKPVRRTAQLMQIEGQVANYVMARNNGGNGQQPQQQSQQRRASQAPTPVGTLQSRGNSSTDDELSDEEAIRRYKYKKFGRS